MSARMESGGNMWFSISDQIHWFSKLKVYMSRISFRLADQTG